MLATIRAVHRICSHILDSGDLVQFHQSAVDSGNAGLPYLNSTTFISDI